MLRRLLLAVMLPGLLIPALAAAQDEPRQEIAVQGTGFFTKDSSGNGINQHSTDTGGFLVSYRYHFSRWFAADATYGYGRNTQENFISSGAFNIEANVHQATGALVVTAPHKIIGLKPYVLAGSGTLIFEPTGIPRGFVSGATNQARPVFLYGGGIDYDLTKHFALRAEYRGFVYERPDFGLQGLHPGATTHTAQPSAGIVFRF
jgi:opacity protein-like surface antigen